MTGHTAAALPLKFCAGLSEHRAMGLLPDPGGDYPHFTDLLYAILASFYLVYSLPSLPHHPNL